MAPGLFDGKDEPLRHAFGFYDLKDELNLVTDHTTAPGGADGVGVKETSRNAGSGV